MSEAAVVQVMVNGKQAEVAAGTTLRQLVESYKLTPEKVALELNKRLARKAQYDQPLMQGDQIEIVTFVGGG